MPDALVGPAVRDASDSRFVGCGAELVDALLTYRRRPVAGPGPIEVGLLPGGCLAVVRDRFLAEGGFAAFSGFGLEAAFPGAITTVLAEPWAAARQRLLASGLRPTADYLDQWAPRAFGP
ncbi:hypothetical protein [Kitasatospora sp. NPDC001683]